MRTLAETQAVLADALRRPMSLVEESALATEVERIASGNDRLSPVEQVDIYREQFWLRHLDCMRDDFASIEHLLGENAFERLAKEYLGVFPSASFTLRNLGDRMVEFVRDRAPWSDDPLIADLARVEWAFASAFDGPDAPPFDPASIAGRSEDEWPGARLVLHPALQRLTLAFPAHDYRIAVKSAQACTRPEPRACNVVVYRGPELLHCLELGDDAAAMLDFLAKGTPLGEACERAATASGTDIEAFQGKLAGWFSEWTSLGWIRSVVF